MSSEGKLNVITSASEGELFEAAVDALHGWTNHSLDSDIDTIYTDSQIPRAEPALRSSQLLLLPASTVFPHLPPPSNPPQKLEQPLALYYPLLIVAH